MKRLVPFFFLAAAVHGKTVVLEEPGFPTVESRPVPRRVLERAIAPEFAGIDALGTSLAGADLLVLPYGSAVPVDGWKAIRSYLDAGGNLLTLGGRALYVPVAQEDGRFVERRPQNSYARYVGITHSYVEPRGGFARFAWDEDYGFFPDLRIRVRRAFVAGGNRGIGYFLDARGDKVAAAVTRQDARNGGRRVFLNFEPEEGFWESEDATVLIRTAAEYARRGAVGLQLEMQNAAVAPGEMAQVLLRLRGPKDKPLDGTVRVELLASGKTIEEHAIPCTGKPVETAVDLGTGRAPGLYTVRGIWEVDGKPAESYRTGFWVRDRKLLESGDRLEISAGGFRKGGAPFVPFGTNYFSTDTQRSGFFTGGGTGNAYMWERDFAEMRARGVNFVRTGTWMNHADYLDGNGEVKERFLRSVEAYLHSAARHGMQVQFTFFAFDPQSIRRKGQASTERWPGTNPYTDPVTIAAEKKYVTAIAGRFKDCPYLSWDLINEPSFSNPKRPWKGNTPNADRTEAAAWNGWLSERYRTSARLAEAWGASTEDLPAFGEIPLPAPEELTLQRYGGERQVRAIDYNLFAQSMFAHWVKEMIAAIREAGSAQAVTVGQDEGGVSDRVLNQFWSGAGVAMTVNHSWWRDDALLWDSVAAKRPGLPSLIGETGVQPAWRADSAWRWDEVTAFGLFERKMALGLAGGSSGSLYWDWSRGDTFGIKRGDGSNKTWMDALEAMCGFGAKAAPYLTGARQPEVAVVLPQSLQLSQFNGYALEAQQKSVRALFHFARAAAYAVGEYQPELLGDPKLIILPSPWVLNETAWQAVLAKARAGATVLVSGRIDLNEYFHATARRPAEGYRPALLAARENVVTWPGGSVRLSYSGDKCTYVERGELPGGNTFAQVPLGNGKLLYFSFPLELNDNLDAIGEVYRFALREAGVRPLYTTAVADPGLLIAPTGFDAATLYVLTSESSGAGGIAFRDAASGREFAGRIAPGRAAMLLVRKDGEIAASYNFKP